MFLLTGRQNLSDNQVSNVSITLMKCIIFYIDTFKTCITCKHIIIAKYPKKVSWIMRLLLYVEYLTLYYIQPSNLCYWFLSEIIDSSRIIFSPSHSFFLSSCLTYLFSVNWWSIETLLHHFGKLIQCVSQSTNKAVIEYSKYFEIHQIRHFS